MIVHPKERNEMKAAGKRGIDWKSRQRGSVS
jgi:hypothetical protein